MVRLLSCILVVTVATGCFMLRGANPYGQSTPTTSDKVAAHSARLEEKVTRGDIYPLRGFFLDQQEHMASGNKCVRFIVAPRIGEAPKDLIQRDDEELQNYQLRHRSLAAAFKRQQLEREVLESRLWRSRSDLVSRLDQLTDLIAALKDEEAKSYLRLLVFNIDEYLREDREASGRLFESLASADESNRPRIDEVIRHERENHNGDLLLLELRRKDRALRLDPRVSRIYRGCYKVRTALSRGSHEDLGAMIRLLQLEKPESVRAAQSISLTWRMLQQRMFESSPVGTLASHTTQEDIQVFVRRHEDKVEQYEDAVASVVHVRRSESVEPFEDYDVYAVYLRDWSHGGAWVIAAVFDDEGLGTRAVDAIIRKGVPEAFEFGVDVLREQVDFLP